MIPFCPQKHRAPLPEAGFGRGPLPAPWGEPSSRNPGVEVRALGLLGTRTSTVAAGMEAPPAVCRSDGLALM